MWVCEHVIPASSLGSSGQAKEAPLAESQTSELPRDDLALETLRSSEELWKVKVKVKSCPTLCDPMDCSLSGSFVHGIFQARVLEWGAISFSRGSSGPRNRTRVSLIAGRRFTVGAIRELPRDGLALETLRSSEELWKP